MTSVLNRNVIPYPEPGTVDGIHAGQVRHAVENPRGPVSFRIARFDIGEEDWEQGPAASAYRYYLESSRLPERDCLYDQILADVVEGTVATTSLLAFAIFEPHSSIVCRAVRDYLAHRSCDIEEEFAGVHEVVGILANDSTVNRGAVLAGLVSIGDRRINAVARAARSLLTIGDIRHFARVHNTRMRSSTVEFCLDWLLQLGHAYNRIAVDDIACALMLMVVHDEYGVVEDLSEINYVGFRTTSVLKSQSFESYYCEIAPVFSYLKKDRRFASVISMITEVWDTHREKAPLLRAN